MKKGGGNKFGSLKKKRIIAVNEDELIDDTIDNVPLLLPPLPPSEPAVRMFSKKRDTEKIKKIKMFKHEKCKWLGSIKENFTKIPFDQLVTDKIYIYKLNHISKSVGYYIGRLLGIQNDYYNGPESLQFSVFWWRPPTVQDRGWERATFEVLRNGEKIPLIYNRSHAFNTYKCDFFDIESNDYMNIFADNLEMKSPGEICKMMIEMIDEKYYGIIKDKLPVHEWLYKPPYLKTSFDKDWNPTEYYMTKPGPMYKKARSHFYSQIDPLMNPQNSPIVSRSSSRSRKGGKNNQKTHKRNKTKKLILKK